MELVALRTFQTVVEEGAYCRFAQVEHGAVNVTARIRRLEEELGVELFFRKGRGMELAPSGHVLLDYTRRILSLERQTSAAVRQVGESTGVLRVGSMETFAALHLPGALKVVRERHPLIELRVETDTSAALATKVLEHRLDCAFIAGPVVHPELQFDELVVEELVQVSARGAAVAVQPLIIFREGCAYRSRALAWQRAIGHAAADVMEMGTLEGILGCVGGVGVDLDAAPGGGAVIPRGRSGD